MGGKVMNITISNEEDRDTEEATIQIEVNLLKEFETACKESGTPMTELLSEYMRDIVTNHKQKGLEKPKDDPKYSTRGKRRRVINSIIQQLELVREWEERSRDNTPENFRECESYERYEEIIDMLDEVLDIIEPI
jgi:hypothetical protein